MRAALVSFAAATALAACSNGEHAPQAAVVEEVAQDTRIAAVLVHADWCSSCRILEPKIAEMQAAGPIDGVDFISLDYTARDEAAFFAAADAAGVGPAIRAQLADDVITGILLLVDVDDGAVVADLRKELSPAELRAEIETAAQAA